MGTLPIKQWLDERVEQGHSDAWDIARKVFHEMAEEHKQEGGWVVEGNEFKLVVAKK